MMDKPRIAIVGAGKFGAALAVSLRRSGFSISAIVARPAGSMSRARQLARAVGARATGDPGKIAADLVWFCVPDSEIVRVGRVLAVHGEWKGRAAFHSSGALTSDELGELRNAGAAVAAVHPLMTFVAGARPALAGVPFAIEGDPAAVRVAQRIVRGLGGRAYSIAKEDKAAYHAWGTFASPLLTALLATTEQVAVRAGVNRKQARERMLPILAQTLANYGALGAEESFSGPVIRGDVGTVRRHLEVLRGVPAAREVYVALAAAALEYLPAKNKPALRRLLNSLPH